MNDDAFELPYNEEQWERLLQQSEARSARYSDLFETLLHHPDRDEIIAQEMGWDDEDDEEEQLPFDRRPTVEEMNQQAEEALQDAEESDEWEEDAPVENIPAYAAAYRWGLDVHSALQSQLDGDEELEPDDPVMAAFSHSLVVAAKLAGGHGIGYEEEGICGNIVCCNIALKAGQAAVSALEQIRNPAIDSAALAELILRGRQVLNLVEERIAELRSRVWWQ